MRWNLLEQNCTPLQINYLSEKLGVSPVVSKLLLIRGISNFEQSKDFFRPQLDYIHDPFLMKGMTLAVNRLDKAIASHEKIMVFGDYDVDGTTSVSLVYSVLSKFTKQLDTYIPDRYAEGYGMSYQGIDYAKKQGVTLMLVLDCGTKDVEKIKYARDLGIDIVICDHHTPGSVLPESIALLNPKQQDCAYPYKELSACGVAFQFMHAWLKQNQHPLNLVYDHLDLLAISIACDIVPLTHENRILAYYGLKRINEQTNLGVRALFERSGKPAGIKTISDLVFVIGPRINAAGRVDHGKKIVTLLTTSNQQDIEQLADDISKNNEDRRVLDKNITQEALEMIAQDPFYAQSASTVLYKDTWHKGVVGIVASRVIEKHYKPTIVLTQSNGKATGSARSVKGFNVYDAILECADVLEQFGGHMYAAGLTLKAEDVDIFRQRFEDVVQKRITPDLLIPSLDIDAEIMLEDINAKFMRILQQFQPFGPGNMNPIFVSRGLKDAGYTALVGADKKHVKFHVQYNGGKPVKGIMFNGASFYDQIKSGQTFDVAYTIEENNWQGNITYEMNVKDLCFRQ